MLRELNELERALLNIWKEVLARRGKERAHRVSGDVLLDSNSRVDVQRLVKIEVLDLNWLALVNDGNGVCEVRAGGRECGERLGGRNYKRVSHLRMAKVGNDLRPIGSLPPSSSLQLVMCTGTTFGNQGANLSPHTQAMTPKKS